VRKESTQLIKLLVGAQRRPATTMLVVYGLLAAGAWAVFRISESFGACAYLVFAVCVTTATAEVLARAASLWARLAVFGLGVSATIPLLMAMSGGNVPRGSEVAASALFISTVTATPHAVVALASRVPALGSAAARRIAVLMAMNALLAMSWCDRHDPSQALRIGLLVFWFLTIQMACHASAASATRVRLVVLEVVLAGVACEVAFQLTDADHFARHHFGLGLAAGWLVGSLLVPAARTGRSFTAVPLDHPIYTDFGGPRRGG
jgi:hypothetical protein